MRMWRTIRCGTWTRAVSCCSCLSRLRRPADLPRRMSCSPAVAWLSRGAAIYSATQHLPDVTATDVARPDSCDDDPCPPCKTTSGKIVPVGTIGYRPLDTPSKPQHGIAGPHCDETTPNKGPIPRGRYTARSRDLSNPPWFKDIARNLPGLGADWGGIGEYGYAQVRKLKHLVGLGSSYTGDPYGVQPAVLMLAEVFLGASLLISFCKIS